VAFNSLRRLTYAAPFLFLGACSGGVNEATEPTLPVDEQRQGSDEQGDASLGDVFLDEALTGSDEAPFIQTLLLDDVQEEEVNDNVAKAIVGMVQTLARPIDVTIAGYDDMRVGTSYPIEPEARGHLIAFARTVTSAVVFFEEATAGLDSADRLQEEAFISALELYSSDEGTYMVGPAITVLNFEFLDSPLSTIASSVCYGGTDLLTSNQELTDPVTYALTKWGVCETIGLATEFAENGVDYVAYVEAHNQSYNRGGENTIVVSEIDRDTYALLSETFGAIDNGAPLPAPEPEVENFSEGTYVASA
jgi:hypothetical protein